MKNTGVAKSSIEEKWKNLACALLVCIVLVRLCNWYGNVHWETEKLAMLICFFHMPTAFFILGCLSKEAIRQRRVRLAGSFVLLCFATGGLTFAAQSLVGKSESLSLINSSDVHSYALALAICMMATIYLSQLDRRWVMGFAVVLACMAGYDEQIGDFLAISRAIVLFPFFYVGYAIDTESLQKRAGDKKTQALSVVLLLVFVVLVLVFRDKIYYLKPLLTAREGFGSLAKGWGWLLRLLYYPVVLSLVFALVSVTPSRPLPVVGNMGQSAVAAFALSNCVFYLLMVLFRLDAWVDSLHGVRFYAALLGLAFVIPWLSGRPKLDLLLRRCLLLPSPADGKASETDRAVSLAGVLHNMKTVSGQSFLCLLASALFLTFTLCLYGPIKLFIGNSEDFWFSMKELLVVVIPVFLTVTAVLLLVGCMLSEKARGTYTKILFGLAMGLYLQGTYINANYGVLDGTEIDWSQYTGLAIWNTAVWTACLALPFVLGIIPKTKKNTGRILLYASAFFLAIQIPAMAVDLINYTPKRGGELTVTTDGIYDLSGEENFIILLFDTMDEQYFRTFFENHKEYAEKLDGFIHYDNMLSSGARTIVAMPAMMTGVPFVRDMLYSEYIESIWSKDTPLSAMDKAGWDVRCYLESFLMGQGAAKYVRNLSLSGKNVGSYVTLGEKLYKLTAFRFAPHLMKPLFWMDTSEFDEAVSQTTENGKTEFATNNDALFYRNYLDNGGYRISSDYDKAFRLYLLRGAHSPYKLSADGLDNSKKTSLEEQVEGNFSLLKAILQDLKEKGLYDSSTIIVSADHGDKGYAQHPMFLYKAAGASGEMMTSHVPASMFDLYMLFYDAAGSTAPENPYAMDFRSLKEGETRERRFFKNGANSASRVVIDEYVTTDLAEETKKMTIVHEYLGEDKDIPYQLGEKLSFGLDTTANRYCVDGFAGSNGFTTPLMGPYAHMEIPIDKLPASGTLEVHIDLGSPVSHETNVSVFANGKPVLEKEITLKTQKPALDFTMDIDNVFENDDSLLNLEFYLDAVSMDEMARNLRERTRLISFVSLVIRQVQ